MVEPAHCLLFPLNESKNRSCEKKRKKSWRLGNDRVHRPLIAGNGHANIGLAGPALTTRSADAHAPHFRSLLQVVPGEFPALLELKLIIQWFGVVIVHQYEGLSGLEFFISLEDQRMPILSGERSNIQNFRHISILPSISGVTFSMKERKPDHNEFRTCTIE